MLLKIEGERIVVHLGEHYVNHGLCIVFAALGDRYTSSCGLASIPQV